MTYGFFHGLFGLSHSLKSAQLTHAVTGRIGMSGVEGVPDSQKDDVPEMPLCIPRKRRPPRNPSTSGLPAVG